jgi:acylphosphatase
LLKHFNITVTGKVQGVFFRASTQTTALKLGLKGFVQNERDGNVYLEAEGEEEQLKKLVEWCHTGSPHSQVKEVNVTEGTIKNFPDFRIKRSD